MNFTVVGCEKGKRSVFRYFYRGDTDVDVAEVLGAFQKDFVGAGYHPADITFLEVYNHKKKEMTRVKSHFLASQPLYFDERLGR